MDLGFGIQRSLRSGLRSATTPIAEEFDRGDRALLFEDLVDRANGWLSQVKRDVNERITAADIVEPDFLNNKNRLYKAPLSVHSSLDGVVTSIPTDRPRYRFTELGEVSPELIADAEEWAARYTADYTEAVGSVVKTLWPDHYTEAGSWRDALATRLEEMKEERERNRQRERSRPDPEGIPDDIEKTEDLDVISAKIEDIDVRDLARDVADAWDTAPGRDPPRFEPPWRGSDSGQSCFADRDKFVNLAEGSSKNNEDNGKNEAGDSGGGPITLITRAEGIIGDCSDKVRGDDYWKAVNALRKHGYDIPYFTGANGTHPDVMRLYEEPGTEEEAMKQFARALIAESRK